LIELINKGLLKGAFILECSASVYRKKFDITAEPFDLRVPAHMINGNVVASCYLYATEDIPKFESTGFISDYAEYSFDIDKFDILSVDDGYKFKIELDPKEDDKVASIFTIVKKEDNGDVMTYANKDKSIVIYLPAKYYDSYDNIKMRRECNNIAFAMIAIPVLASCLDDLYASYYSIEEMLEEHSWFNAVCISYKRKMNHDLTYDDFENTNKLELAQIVLNSASCNGINDFENMLLGDVAGVDEEIEDE